MLIVTATISGKTLPELMIAFDAMRDWLLDARLSGEASLGFASFKYNVTGRVEEGPVCARCEGKLRPIGYCVDETCPFSNHKQPCPAGWVGHPEHVEGHCNCS